MNALYATQLRRDQQLKGLNISHFFFYKVILGLLICQCSEIITSFL